MEKNPELLVNVTRGPIVESRHWGHVAVANSKGELLAYLGNPDTVTYMRSAAKPIQAINVIVSGAAEKYHFSDKELAIMCSSHYGEDMHREVIQGILDKIDLPMDALRCGTSPSINPEYQRKQLLENHKIIQSNSDCSGKHSGFLAVCQCKGYPTENYDSADHPMQKEVLSILSDFSEVKEDDIPIGTDGCGVPVHAFSLRNMAMAYAKFSNPEKAPKQYRNACERLYVAMNAFPEMIAGPGGFCTEFLRYTHGKFCGKVGAEAVYCIGVKGRDMGIIVKVEDGNLRALYPAVMGVLMQLDLLDKEEIKNLESFIEPDNYNDHGNKIGNIKKAFTLHKL